MDFTRYNAIQTELVPDTTAPIKPETSDVSRPLKEGELGEWILLDGVRLSGSGLEVLV